MKTIKLRIIVTEKVTISDTTDIEDLIKRLKESSKIGEYPKYKKNEFVECTFETNEYLELHKDPNTKTSYIELYDEDDNLLWCSE